MRKGLLVLGASSAIARAAAFEFAKNGYSIYLAGRDEADLERVASDIRLRFQVKVKHGFFDAAAFAAHQSFLERALIEMPEIEGVLLAFGKLGDHKKAIVDFGEAQSIITSNYTGAVSILTHCANYLARQQKGFIIALSSVAGDRGRQSNYVYGSAKGGLTLFLQGLRNRLHPLGVKVLTVKPGFVDTAMTFGLPGMFLVASPSCVGRKIFKALEKRQNNIYAPAFWRPVMAVIKMLPESIFKRLKL